MKQLILRLLRVGLIGFGGGSALIPVIEQEVTEENALISKEEYDKDVIVASLTPGALPVELAGQIGAKLAGPLGMLCGAVSMALPGALLTILLVTIMSAANASVLTQVNYMAVGVTAFISCMLTEYVHGTVVQFHKLKRMRRAVIIMLGVFVLTAGKNIFRIFQLGGEPLLVLSTLDVLLLAFFSIVYTKCKFTLKNSMVVGVFCVLYFVGIFLEDSAQYALLGQYLLYVLRIVVLFTLVWGVRTDLPIRKKTRDFPKHSRKKTAAAKKQKPKYTAIKRAGRELFAALVFCLILSIPALLCMSQGFMYLVNGWVSSLLSFGGGDAYLTTADGLFVANGMLPEDIFYGTLVPVVNVLPGSILCKMLSGIGYYLGYLETGSAMVGVLCAICGFGMSIAASCGVVSVVRYLYERYESVNVFILIKRWIRPIISGLLLTVVLSLVYQNMKIGISVGHPYRYVVYMLLLYGGDLLLFYKKRLHNGWLILFSVLGALLLCNIFG